MAALLILALGAAVVGLAVYAHRARLSGLLHLSRDHKALRAAHDELRAHQATIRRHVEIADQSGIPLTGAELLHLIDHHTSKESPR